MSTIHKAKGMEWRCVLLPALSEGLCPAEERGAVAKSRAEIWADLDGRIDGFVSAVGTGGTLAGVGMGLKPPQHLKAGDVVELGISKLGSQRQRAEQRQNQDLEPYHRLHRPHRPKAPP